MDVAGDAAPLGDRSRQHRELVAQQDDVGDALGDLTAGAHRDREPRLLERRDVVDAVADHRREAAALGERADQRLLLLRRDPAEDGVAKRRLGEPALVVRQVGAVDDGRVAGNPDRLRDRGHGLARVAGDQLQVDLLVAHVGDRVGGVWTQGLLEDDQGPRLERRRRLGCRIGGQPAAGLAEGDDAATGAGVLRERALQALGQRAGLRRGSARPGRRSRSWSRSGSSRSTSTATRTAPRRSAARGGPGSSRRSSPGCGCARRRRRRTWRGRARRRRRGSGRRRRSR